MAFEKLKSCLRKVVDVQVGCAHLTYSRKATSLAAPMTAKPDAVLHRRDHRESLAIRMVRKLKTAELT